MKRNNRSSRTRTPKKAPSKVVTSMVPERFNSHGSGQNGVVCGVHIHFYVPSVGVLSSPEAEVTIILAHARILANTSLLLATHCTRTTSQVTKNYSHCSVKAKAQEFDSTASQDNWNRFFARQRLGIKAKKSFGSWCTPNYPFFWPFRISEPFI